MKRYFALVCVFMMCLTMALPVMAAEEYEFYPAQMTVYDLNLDPAGDGAFMCNTFISDGVYVLSGTLQDGSTITSAPFELIFDVGSDMEFAYMNSPFSINGNIVSFSGYFYNFLDSNMSAFVPNDGDLYNCEYFVLSTYEPGPKNPLLDNVNSELLDDVFIQVLDLLPIVLAVIVGYIALRKAISWLFGVLHSS